MANWIVCTFGQDGRLPSPTGPTNRRPAETPQRAPADNTITASQTMAIGNQQSPIEPNRFDLDLQVDAVEFVKATPGPRGRNALEELAHGLNAKKSARFHSKMKDVPTSPNHCEA